MSKRPKTTKVVIRKKSATIKFSEKDGREVAKRLNNGEGLLEALFGGPKEKKKL